MKNGRITLLAGLCLLAITSLACAQVTDSVVFPPDGPLDPLAAHDVKIEAGKTIVTLDTPTAGAAVFVCEAVVDVADAVAGKYQSGQQWKTLKPQQMAQDHSLDWDQRNFYWTVDIPAGQKRTTFVITCKMPHRSRIVAVAIAKAGTERVEIRPAPTAVRAKTVEPVKIDPSQKVSTKAHPYLFFTAGDLPRIRATSRKQPNAMFRRSVQSSARRLKPEQLVGPGRRPNYKDRVACGNMARAALEGMLAKNAALTAKAKKTLLNLTSWEHMSNLVNMGHGGVMRNAALTYDLLYNDLTPAEREQVERFLIKGAEFIYADWTGDALHHWHGKGTRNANWRPTILSGMGMAGLALWDKHPDAPKWVAAARDGMVWCLDYDFDGQGAIYETLTRYGANVEFHSIISFIDALRRVTGEDLYDRNDRVLEKFATFIAYMLYPTRDALPSIGDSGNGTYPIGLPLLMSAVKYKDGLAAWYVKKLAADGYSPSSDSPFYGTVWAWDDSVVPQNPDTSDKLAEAFAYDNDAAAAGIDKLTDHASGHVFLRTGFAKKDDIFFVAQAGDNQGYHGHSDQGSYFLAAYGVRFLRDFFAGAYSGDRFKYRHHGLAHQTVLIDGEGQGSELHGLADPDYQTKIADVEVLESHKGYDYVRMDLLQAYRFNQHNRTMRKAKRHVVFVRQPNREGYFVVIDDFQRDDKPHVYSHAFHYEPKVKVAKAEGGRVKLFNPIASLHIAAVVPAKFKAQKQTKYKDSFILLTATEPTVRFTMVTVLYPVRGRAAAPAFTPIDDASQAGVEIEGVRIVLDKASGAVSVTGALSDITARGVSRIGSK